VKSKTKLRSLAPRSFLLGLFFADLGVLTWWVSNDKINYQKSKGKVKGYEQSI